MIFAYKNVKNNTWEKISSILTLTDSIYINNNWIIRNFQVNANEYSYADKLLLIDLTASFGAGKEPSKEWCDDNIDYFNGTTIIYE